MTATDASSRQSALDRLSAHAPFLARLAQLNPDDVARFLVDGTDTALALVIAPPVDDDIMRTLRQWRGRIALLLALGDLSGEHDVATTTRLLSNFADQACDAALAAAFAERVPDAEPRGLAVIALGKLGGRELNYSSDIDPILLYDPETLPRRAARGARRGGGADRRGAWSRSVRRAPATAMCFRVDLRLRPSPEVTPIALPVDAAISYYEMRGACRGSGRPSSARAPAAGDRALGERFPRRDPALRLAPQPRFRRSSRRSARSAAGSATILRRGRRSARAIDLKRGRGGIREIEFFAQIHQLIHGGRDPALRAPATVDALAALADGRADRGR